MSRSIESLMKELEEKRLEERIAALTEEPAGPVRWKVIPQPNACERCREFAAHTYVEKPEPPHPHCKCRIVREENPTKEDSTKRYYVIGRRRLKSWLSSSSNIENYKNDKDIYTRGHKNPSSLRLEHQQFFDSQGNNFGFFSDSQVQPDSPSLISEYIFGDVKYDADIIEEAAAQYEQEKQTIEEIIEEKLYTLPSLHVTDYDLLANNCQNYINEVLERARRIAKEKNKPLILP